MSTPRRKVFISYHHADQEEVEAFIETFDAEQDIIISRAVGMSYDIVNSTDTDYVMRKIRENYLRDSTVTIVLMGKCTWARRYVDWEIQASLRHGENTTPNGLIGIRLPSYNKNGYPNRLNKNLKQSKDQKDCYARAYGYPTSAEQLTRWIEDVYKARTERAHLIVNPRDRFSYNRTCP